MEPTRPEQPQGSSDDIVPRNAGQYPVGLGDADYPVSTNGRVRCDGKNRSGGRCKKYALRGTSLCKLHSGLSAQELRTRSRYAAYFESDDTLEERFLDFLEDPDICDLRPELAVQRALLATFLELASVGDGKGFLNTQIASGVTELNKSVAALAEQVSRIERRGERSVSVDQLQFFVHAVSDVIAEHVSDPATLDAIQRSLELLALPLSERAAAFAYLEGRGLDSQVPATRRGSGGEGSNGDSS